MSQNVIIGKPRALGFQWPMESPFIFCAHHDDHYPEGQENMGPLPGQLRGREIGMDFEGKDGWRMYHGNKVPGFPQHPHRGFETITIVRKGLIDHTDSTGAAARFGGGADTQWLTAGGGIVHCEMFPLVEREKKNPLELFQIWLNLDKANKMVPPYFTMFWDEDIPRGVVTDENGKKTHITVVANGLRKEMPWGGEASVPAPPPNSWASKPDSHLWIWTIKMEPGAKLKIPAAVEGLNRNIFFFEGKSMTVSSGPDPVTAVDSRQFPGSVAIKLRSDADVYLENGPDAEGEILLLQGRPINEPIAQRGPFVMNTDLEIRQAFMDYQSTRFGGWPFVSDEPVHSRESGRFARHSDGKIERPGQKDAKVTGIAPRHDEL